ncbi:MAG: PAS domain S-box protein [Mariprofundaceae bacterium]|nr:PAS domain S-box protein [Mariprofundaceae bacterium]
MTIKTNNRAPEQEKRVRKLLAFILLAVLMVLITLNLHSMWKSAQLRESSAIQMLNLSRYSANLATAHLWLEESISSNNQQTLQLYKQAFGRSEQACLRLLQADAPLLQHDIPRLQQHLHQLQVLAQQRIRNPSKSGVNSPSDEQFDRLFSHTMSAADTISHSISQSAEAEQKQQQWLRKITATLSFLLLLIGALNVRMSSLRIRDMEQAERNSIQAMRQSEQRFRTFFEESPIALKEEDHSAVRCLLDSLSPEAKRNLRDYLEQHPEFLARCIASITILDANRAATHLYGYDNKQQLIDDSQRYLQQNTQHIAFIEKLIFLQQGDPHRSSRITLCNQQGAVVHAILSINILPGYETTWSNVVVSLVDISDQQRMQQNLAKSEQHLQQAQSVAAIGSWELDSRNGARQWSNEVYRIFQLDHPPLPSYDLFIAAVHPDDRHRVEQAWTNHAESKAEYNIVHRMILPHGELRYVQERCLSSYDEQGTIIHSLGTIQDVTRLMLAEQEAHLLQDVLQASPDMIAIAQHDLSLMYANQALRRNLGISDEHDLQGLHIADCFDTTAQTELNSQSLPTLLREGVWQGESQMFNQQQRVLCVSCIMQAHHHDDGRLSHVSLIARDISIEKIQQQKLEHTQRLESLGVLAGGIAHDFNNLLTAIMGHTAMAQECLAEPPVLQQHLENILQSSHSAADLCRQMLAYSGKGQFVLQPMNLSTTVKQMARLLAVSIDKQVSMHYTLADPLPAVVVDPSQMQQVIMNLVINASEAIDSHNGNIHVQTGCKFYPSSDLQSPYISEPLIAGDYVYLEVRDDGNGMGEDVQARLFEPFFTTKFTGRGLGMSAILGIISAHHGTITLSSKIGQGTTFRVLIPADATTRHHDVPAPPAVEKTTIEHEGYVLIVDDEATIRQVACMIVQAMGLKVKEAVDGVDAVELFTAHQHEISCVVLDMTMPRMNGRETMTALRAIQADLPIILSSGYHEHDGLETQKNVAHTAFVHKPYPPKLLQETIAKLLKQSMIS